MIIGQLLLDHDGWKLLFRRRTLKSRRRSLQLWSSPRPVFLEGFFASEGCFLKWWYPQNTPKWSFSVGKPMVVGYPYFWKHPDSSSFLLHMPQCLISVLTHVRMTFVISQVFFESTLNSCCWKLESANWHLFEVLCCLNHCCVSLLTCHDNFDRSQPMFQWSKHLQIPLVSIGCSMT